MSLRSGFLALTLCLAACGGPPPNTPGAAREAAPTLALTTLDGAARAGLDTFGGQVQVVMFWRSDCARCLIELEHIRSLESAAAPGAVITVALQSGDSAADKAAALGLHPARSFAVAEDPAAALAKFSAGGQKIPFALVLDKDGRVCARHTGLLGAQRVREWTSQCSA